MTLHLKIANTKRAFCICNCNAYLPMKVSVTQTTLSYRKRKLFCTVYSSLSNKRAACSYQFYEKFTMADFFKHLFKQSNIKTIAICQKYDCLFLTNLIYKQEKFLEGFEPLVGF